MSRTMLKMLRGAQEMKNVTLTTTSIRLVFRRRCIWRARLNHLFCCFHQSLFGSHWSLFTSHIDLHLVIIRISIWFSWISIRLLIYSVFIDPFDLYLVLILISRLLEVKIVSRSVGWSVCLSVIIAYKYGKPHLHAHIGALVYKSLFGLHWYIFSVLIFP